MVHARLPGRLLVVLANGLADAAHLLQGIADAALAEDGCGAQTRDLAMQFLQTVPEHGVITAVQQGVVETLDRLELTGDVLLLDGRLQHVQRGVQLGALRRSGQVDEVPCRQPFQDGPHLVDIGGFPRIQGGYRDASVRPVLHEPFLLQQLQRLAHGRPAGAGELTERPLRQSHPRTPAAGQDFLPDRIRHFGAFGHDFLLLNKYLGPRPLLRASITTAPAHPTIIMKLSDNL